MIVIKVPVTKVVSLPSSADDWELYTHAPGIQHVANDLTATLTRCIAEGLDRGQTYYTMTRRMQHHRMAGADDSEPHVVLRAALDSIYGDPNATL